MAALTGAISGGFFAGAGLMGAGLDSVVQAGIHVAAGAMSSAINAGIAGGSVLQSAVIGGFSAGVAKYAMIKIVPNACFCKQVGELAGEWGQFGMEGAVAVGTGTVMGGFSSKMMGGSFGQGARLGAWTSAHGFLFNRGAHKMLFPSIRDWIRRNVTPSDMIDAMLSQVSSWPTNATPIAFLSNILWRPDDIVILVEKYLIDNCDRGTDQFII